MGASKTHQERVSERAAPEFRRSLEVVGLTADNESAPFAFVHGFLQIHAMKYLHTMVRVTDIEQSLRFYRDALGLQE